MRTKTAIVAALLMMASNASVFGQTEFSGTFTFGADGNVTSFVYNGEAIPNVTVGNLLKVGITTSSSSGNFRGSNWPLGATDGSSTFSGSVDLEKYIELTLTAAPGFEIDMGSLTFGVGRSAAGPRQWQWRSSVDSFASPIDTYTTVNVGLSEEGGVLTNPDANSSWTGNVLDASSFIGLATVTFRLYGFNSESAGGTAGLQGPLSFSGSVQVGSGEVPLQVGFDKTSGFQVLEGLSETVTALAAGGEAPYSYDWESTLGGSFYSADGAEFTILDTAPPGSYTATVTVTDDVADEVEETISFSVIARYAINIAPSVGGTVSTAPAGLAVEGATVTITATPDENYRVSSVVVVASDSEPQSVTANSFIMPASEVTVTVVFAELPAGSVFVDFEDAAKTSYAAGNVTMSGLSWELAESVIGILDADKKNGTKSLRMRTNEVAAITLLEDLAGGVGSVSFLHAKYGADADSEVTLEYSTDEGVTWEVAAVLSVTSTNLTLFSAEINQDGGVRIRIVKTGGVPANTRVNIDDILITPFGEGPGPDPDAVEVTGFTVVGGNPAATFTAVAGRSYYLVYTTDLTEISTVTPPVLGEWEVAASITDATAGIQTLTDTSATDAARFYGILETLSPLP